VPLVPVRPPAAYPYAAGGLEETDLRVAAGQAAGPTCPNPREVTVDGVPALLTAAQEVAEPRVGA
jgi:maleylacetate reductase